MTKTKKILLTVGIVLLVACLALVLAFCGKPGSNEPDTQPGGEQNEELTYTVQVTYESGAVLEGVGVYVYEDETKAELVWFDKTDAAGQMSFTAPESDTYVAVLTDLPAGTLIEQETYPITGTQTTIVLKMGELQEVDPADVRYELGDTVMDFTVVDTDGTEHKLSELLQDKKAVVLNFWYIECNPCRAEFPYLQEAYEQYSDRIEVIAMNPVNTEEADIAAFKSELGLTFPVAMADPVWADMLQLTAYPTTVVIDRYGVISLIHKGSIDSTDTFKQILDYFAAEDYVQGVVESLEDLPPLEEEDTLGTAENPDELGATGTKLTLKPGQEYYLHFYKASGMYMNVTGTDFYVIYDGKKTESSSGYVGMLVESEGIYYPVEVVIGNPTDKEQNISVAFGALKGTSGNPYKLALGEFTMNTYAGNEEGVFGSYTAEESGTLTVRCVSSSVSKYGFFLYNLRSYAMRNTNQDGERDEDGYLYTSVQVKKGDTISFSVAVDRDENNFISAGSFRFELILNEGDGEEDKKAEPPKTAYSITVTDQDNNPVAGVGVNLKGAFTYEPTENDPEGLEPTEVKVDLNLTTDAEGHIVSEQVSGPYTAVIRVPEGYRLEQTQYELTAETNTVTVQLQKIITADYVITVTDAEGNPVSGVSLMMGANLGTTDEAGVYTIHLEEAEYSVFVIAGVPEGYVTPTDAFLIPVGESQLTIQLEKEAEEPHVHEYTAVVTEPTCTEKGYTTYTCACGDSYVGDEVEATGHKYEAVVTAPTCTEKGYTTYTCACGDSYVGDEVEATGHKYEAVVTAPTCTEKGYTTYTCACGDSYVGDEVEATGHKYEAVVTAPTCTEKGYTTYTCACGDSYVGDEVEATGHKYETVVTAPTCTEKGYTTYTCACGDSYVGDEVEATGHKYEAVVTAPTCTEKGYTTYTCACGDSYVGDEVEAAGHKYEAVVTEPTCTESGYTTYTCSVCGDTDTADEVAALGHDYVSEVIEPTTTAEGYTLHTCSRCGDSYKDTFTDKLPEDPELPPHVHEYTAVVTAPTCTEKGYTTYTCACGHSYVGDEVAAVGHVYETVVTEPTCTKGGYTTYTCTVCDETHVGNEVGAVGHKYEAVVTEPTCTEGGYTTYTCAVCGETYVGDEVEATGHKYEAVVTAPTCTEKGYTTYTCACGDTYVGDEVEATGHKYEAVVTAPTCTEKGYTTYTCACGHSYVGDEVEAAGHKYEAVVTEPTCTEGGYTTYTCSVCGDTDTADEVAALGHDYVSEVIAPTTTAEGYTLHTCSRCGDSYKDTFTDKLPEVSDTVTYTVTVTGFDGTAMSGVAVQILNNGSPAKVGVTGADGTFTAALKPGDYTVKLAFSSTGNHYEEKTAVLSADAPELKILVTSTVPTAGIEDHWMLGKADAVGLGGTYVSIQKDVLTYFLFTPEEAGTYRFTTSDPEAIISYWGGENFPSDQTSGTDYKDNVFTLSVNESYLGQTYVLGVTGADDCILIIERQGAAAFDPNEVPYTAYELEKEPEPFTLVKDGTLTYVDLSGDAADYEPVLGSDGYYHLGTADGPVMYVCLSSRAPYLSLYSMCGGGGVTGAPFRYADYSDLDNLVKEDYTQCILDYGACMDPEYGVYPLTADLIYILQKGVEHMGWADPEHPNFYFAEVENFNPELGWMFACCYLVK